jgi:hypothetical protein
MDYLHTYEHMCIHQQADKAGKSEMGIHAVGVASQQILEI